MMIGLSILYFVNFVNRRSALSSEVSVVFACRETYFGNIAPLFFGLQRGIAVHEGDCSYDKSEKMCVQMSKSMIQ